MPYRDTTLACPWCGVSQANLAILIPHEVRPVITTVACEHCGKPIKALLMPHVSWTLTLERGSEPDANEAE